MDPRELVKFAEDYLSEYVRAFFITLRSPQVIFKPISLPDNNETEIASVLRPETRDMILNPKLWRFLLISILIGFTIQALIPEIGPRPNLLTAAIVILLFWLLYSSLAHLVCRLFSGRGTFLQTLSISLQLFAVIHVLSSFAALLWGITINNTRLGIYLSSLGTSIADLVSKPVYIYFLFQFGLITVYFPIAVKQVHHLSWLSFRRRHRKE